MKPFLISRLFTLPFLLLGFCAANAQDCQAIIPQLVNSIPAYNTVDSAINLCVGQTLQVMGSALYPENGTNYNQSDGTSTFTWDFGNGVIKENIQTGNVYNSAGGFKLILTVTDTLGCVNDTPFVIPVRVFGPPNINLVRAPEGPYCPGTEIAFYPEIEPVNYVFQDVGIEDTLFIPDGDGNSVTSTYPISGFMPDQVISQESDLQSVCAVLEHSYMRDLEIKLRCPNGSEIILHEHAGQTGGEVWLGEPFEADEIGPGIPGVGYDYCWTPNAVFGTMLEVANTVMPETLPAGDYQPFDSFSDLVGCPLNGDWELDITDLWGIDNGFLFSWDLDFASSLNPPSDTSGFAPFASEIINTEWLADPVIDSIVVDTVYASPDAAHTFQLTTENDKGCVFTSDLTISDFLSAGDPACGDCDGIVADAWVEPIITYCEGTLLLGGPNTTIGAFLDYQWTTVDGNILEGDNTPNALVSAPGTYFLTVTSPFTGCDSTDMVQVIPDPNAPVADAGPDIAVQCDTSAIQLDGSGSSQGGMYEYQWQVIDGQLSIENGANTLNPLVKGSGILRLTVIDVNSACTDTDDVEITQSVDLLIDFVTTPAGCDAADGSITIVLLPGTPPATFEWSDGQTGQEATGLAQGWYSVTVNADDCIGEQNIYLDSDLSCKVQIKGTVYDDSFNQDCLPDAQTYPLEQIMVQLLPIGNYAFTDENGAYTFIADPGDYSVKYIDEDVYSLICPDSIIEIGDLSAGEISAGNDFFTELDPAVVSNLCAGHFAGAARPGFNQDYHFSICNLGALSSDAIFRITHDSLLQDLSLGTSADDYDPITRTAEWYFFDMPTGSCENIYFLMHVPADVELGTPLTNATELLPADNDDYPYNNFAEWTQIVTGSFDPNDKLTSTGDDQFGGAIYFPQDSVIDYQIRFQNTGTDTAFTVVIKDTLDPDLNVETIRPGMASHDLAVSFEGQNVLVFTFDDILLPDSTTNQEASNGFVTFSIRPYTDLPIGNEIRNKAGIYFDFNAPVITNETVHVISEETATKEAIQGVMDASITPNPNPGSFQLGFTLKKAATLRVELLDGKGVRLSELSEGYYPGGNYRLDYNLTDFPIGLYFIRLTTKFGVKTLPLAIFH